MKKWKLLSIAMLSLSLYGNAQNIDKIINESSVRKTLSTLAADDMRGRKVFTPDINRAADFIAKEFKKAGLSYPTGEKSFLQKFTMYQTAIRNSSTTLDNKTIAPANVIVVSPQAQLDIDEHSGYRINTIKEGEPLFEKVMSAVNSNESNIVIIDTSFSKVFKRLNFLTQAVFPQSHTTILLLGSQAPST